ncbi:hypothetical protein V4C53_29065 [Paraburkholderia azotifigens]|uniref:hypothetical protein n=1 Tax=Paraburkholderia azotifigens TaxID=2057004 RepID=UPI003176993E
MKVAGVLEQAKLAAEDHFKYARFVQNAEMLNDDTDAIPDGEQLSAYQACWFELEIVNALALDEWESDGRPADWATTWTERYKKDAEDLITNLCAILRQQ